MGVSNHNASLYLIYFVITTKRNETKRNFVSHDLNAHVRRTILIAVIGAVSNSSHNFPNLVVKSVDCDTGSNVGAVAAEIPFEQPRHCKQCGYCNCRVAAWGLQRQPPRTTFCRSAVGRGALQDPFKLFAPLQESAALWDRRQLVRVRPRWQRHHEHLQTVKQARQRRDSNASWLADARQQSVQAFERAVRVGSIKPRLQHEFIGGIAIHHPDAIKNVVRRRRFKLKKEGDHSAIRIRNSNLSANKIDCRK